MTSIDVDWLDAWDVEDGSAQARALFTEVFDAAPEGVWSAPGRGNLIGEHTDYNGGLVLPFALPHRTYAAITRRTDRTVRLVSAQEAGTVVTVDLDTVAPGTVPEIEVSGEREGDLVRVAVADNGIGLPAGEHELVFTEFHRAHHREYDGSGLGLAICRRIATRHGGTIRAYDNPAGRGTVFYLTLPAA